MAAGGIRELFRGLRELCFPPACLACGRELPASRAPLFCPPCREDLHFPTSPLCPSCGLPHLKTAGGDHLCGTCLNEAWHFSRARAVLLYHDTAARAIHAFKYGKLTAGLASFAFLFREAPASRDLTAADLILPVPLHPKRLRERGFNQALLLARAFFPHRKEAIHPFLLERCRATPPQTGLAGDVRRRNLKGAFRVQATEAVRGKSLLLVDDVFTTGATVDECARTLLRAGAREVQVLTLARVTDNG